MYARIVSHRGLTSQGSDGDGNGRRVGANHDQIDNDRRLMAVDAQASFVARLHR